MKEFKPKPGKKYLSKMQENDLDNYVEKRRCPIAFFHPEFIKDMETLRRDLPAGAAIIFTADIYGESGSHIDYAVIL